MFQFHPTILQCIGHLLALWNTTLFLRRPNRDPVKLATVSIRCGIFQGDTLSPLLFCLSLNPLSMLLDSMDGYQIMGGRQMNHMLYMDDLKLFAKSDAQLERLLRTVHMFSHDVCLSFGLDKCAKCSVIRGRVVPSNDVFLPDGSSIYQLNVGETYKYLGLFEAEGIDYTKNKKLVMDPYHQRLRLIWSSLLSGPRKSRATNSFCVPLLSYGFGIIPWTVKEIEQFNVSTRKILTATCNHHPRSAVERLYLPRTLGGIGLINVENLFYRRLVTMAHHLSNFSDALVQLCYELDGLLPARSSVSATANSYCAALPINIDFQSCDLISL